MLPGRWAAQIRLEARADSSRDVNPCRWRWAARGRARRGWQATECHLQCRRRRASQLGAPAHREPILRPVVAPPLR